VRAAATVEAGSAEVAGRGLGDDMAALEAAADAAAGTRLSGFVSAGVIQQGKPDDAAAAAPGARVLLSLSDAARGGRRALPPGDSAACPPCRACGARPRTRDGPPVRSLAASALPGAAGPAAAAGQGA